jgi:replicative DNA helicase
VNRAPPSNPLAEESVLGSLLANSTRAYPLCAGLEPAHFFSDTNREIYRAIQRRMEAGRRVDAVTLQGAFESTGLLNSVGGTAYLTHLITCLVGLNMVPEYVAAIRDCAARRAGIVACESAIERFYRTDLEDGDAATTAAWSIGAIEAATAGNVSVGTIGLGAAVDLAMAQSEAAQRGDQAAAGLMTGIPSLDALWGGLFPGNLDIIGARPRTGKSSLAMQISRHVAGLGASVLIFSMEMPARDLGMVNLAAMTGISASDIRRGRYDSAQAHAMILARKQLALLPIDIIDRPAIPLSEAIGLARAHKRRHGCRLVIADHRNLFGRDEGWGKATATDWYRHVTMRLKESAKAIDVAMLCLVQVNRGAEARDDPRPRLGDLDYGGETDADSVVLLYRPALHMGDFPERRANETQETHANKAAAWYARRAEMRDQADAILAKSRFGETGTARLRFTGKTLTFSDWTVAADEAPADDLWTDT